KLWISARAHVITPWHMVKDQQEESKASIALGTTLRGIGPAYTDKVARQGLIMSHYINRQKRSRWLERYKLYDSGFAEFLSSHQDVMSEFFATHHLVEPYVCHLESRLRLRLGEGAKVLCEGAQGTLLDVSHGTYPFVTSSHTIASGAFVSMGVSPNQSTRIIGIAKAYVTRVGEGPFPSELMGSDGQKLARLGNEFGATTGRPRRCGWLDAVALRYACEVNGFHEIFLNKVDILSGFDEIKLCSGYEHEKLGRLEYFPEDVTEYPYLTPVYEVFPSWHLDDLKSQKSSLPKELERFLSRIEEICGVPVTRVGTGPGRDDYLLVK
ncbi:MAG: adenylosuccinate synthetase, partial [Proteobacteria bacterium]|nr:adenylosuccinate synthetase [Pseudomonadota bacterium]